MQHTISKEQLWEKLNLLDPFQQQSIVTLIDSLLKTRANSEERDKRRLLTLSTWTEEDIQVIKETQKRIN